MLLLREMASGIGSGAWGIVNGVLHFSSRLVLFSSTALALLGASLAWIAFPMSDQAVLRSAIVLAMVLVPLRAFAKLRHSGLQGMREIFKAQFPEQCFRPAIMLVLLLSWAAYSGNGLDPRVALGLQIVASASSLLLGSYWLIRKLPREVALSEPEIDARNWTISAAHMLLFSCMTVLLAQSGIIIMGFLAEESEVGVFALGVRLSEALLIFLAATSLPLMPVVAKLYAEGQQKRVQRLLRLSALLSVGAAIPFGASMFVGSGFLLELFGSEFVEGDRVFRMLLIAQLLNVAFGPVGLLLNVSGNERGASIGISAAAVINAVLCLMLVPRIGAEGAALAMLVATLTWNIWLSVLAYRRLGVLPGLLSLIPSSR